MPWELGFFDVYSNGKIAILSVSREQRDDYKGQEYLGVCPYVDADLIRGAQRRALWINRAIDRYGLFDDWLKSGNSTIRKRTQLYYVRSFQSIASIPFRKRDLTWLNISSCDAR